jgi:hypothetical protein
MLTRQTAAEAPPAITTKPPVHSPGGATTQIRVETTDRWVRAVDRFSRVGEVVLAGAAVFGTGVLTATLLNGRTVLLWPSVAWAATAAGTWLVLLILWSLAARVQTVDGFDRWRRSCWPALALLPAAGAAVATYLDDSSNHLLMMYAPARESLLAYTGLLFAVGHGAYWLGRWFRGPREGGAIPYNWTVAPALIGVAGASYLNASVFSQCACLLTVAPNADFSQWLPTQNDLRVNLQGARVLFAGQLPYDSGMPVWADRVHMLPATIVLLFGPLIALPENAARLIFFLGNQVLWLVAMGLLIRRLVPSSERWLWVAGVLVFGATYWPWQEAIRYGQQDGLIVLLFVVSLTAAMKARSLEAGVALGLAFIVKPLSIWLPLMYVVHRQWRALLVAGATVLILVGATIPVTGWQPWWHYVSVEVPEMLPGTVRGTNIPLPSLHARFFVGRERLSDGDAAPHLGAISAMNLASNVLGLLFVTRLALRPMADRRRDWLLDVSIGLTLTLLLAPMAWQHYASWLSIAFVVLCLPRVWQPLSAQTRTGVGVLSGAAFLLIGLNDEKLLALLSPIVERWPGILGFYTLGLFCLISALVLARVSVRPAPVE